MAEGSKSARLSSRCDSIRSLRKGPGVMDIEVQGASSESSLRFAFFVVSLAQQLYFS